MVIDYENLMEDILALNLYHHQQSTEGRRTRQILQYGPPAILVLIALGQVSVFGTAITSSLPWLFFAGIWAFFVPYSLRRNMKKKVARMVLGSDSSRITGQHKLSLSSDAVTDKGNSGKTKTKWAEVHKVVATSRHVFIYISDTAAHIVPRRAFEDESKYREFVDMAMRYYKAAIG